LAANAITADKLSAGAIDGQVITGAVLRTSPSGARTEVTPDGVSVYNEENVLQAILGHGIETGLAIRNPTTGEMVPLGRRIFGGTEVQWLGTTTFPWATAPSSFVKWSWGVAVVQRQNSTAYFPSRTVAHDMQYGGDGDVYRAAVPHLIIETGKTYTPLSSSNSLTGAIKVIITTTNITKPTYYTGGQHIYAGDQANLSKFWTGPTVNMIIRPMLVPRTTGLPTVYPVPYWPSVTIPNVGSYAWNGVTKGANNVEEYSRAIEADFTLVANVIYDVKWDVYPVFFTHAQPTSQSVAQDEDHIINQDTVRNQIPQGTSDYKFREGQISPLRSRRFEHNVWSQEAGTAFYQASYNADEQLVYRNDGQYIIPGPFTLKELTVSMYSN
jgi:hypothetical protein